MDRPAAAEKTRSRRSASGQHPQWQTRAPEGLLDLWTRQSRRIRRSPETTDEGLRVTRVMVAAGDRTPPKRPARPARTDRAKPRITMRWMTITSLGVGCGFLSPF
ncbi:type I-E CRISPR-associated protein Cse1/CasA [Streptomyces sp. NPDC050448]|uniref:type I-E CRISPR-associated protein Cse1/CasA n=1 Tax=Streptomyces sp. NPDC050448 TaxID=3155404 RepID=UPI003427769C